jgi:hypothetical protein
VIEEIEEEREMGKKLTLFAVCALLAAGATSAVVRQDLQENVTTASVGDIVQLSTVQGIKTYKVVERYSGRVTTLVDMPGTDTADGVFWTGVQNITRIDFEAGAGTHNGQTIELDGLESQFAGPHYSGSMVLAVGPDHRAEAKTVVNGSGDSAAQGPVNASGSLIYKNVGVEAGLDKNNLALTLGSTSTLTSTTNNWQSETVPQLNNQNVSTQCAVTPVAIDAANGIIERNFTGTIMAQTSPVIQEQELPPVNQAASGALLLGFGVIGAVIAARKRS